MKEKERVDLIGEDFSMRCWVRGGGDQERLPYLKIFLHDKARRDFFERPASNVFQH